jgi:hypothetical protein
MVCLKSVETSHVLADRARNINIVTGNKLFKATQMAIKPTCDMCGEELKEFGGILLSPPQGILVKKFHLCVDCYTKVAGQLEKK